MLSILLAAHNARGYTAQCLRTLVKTFELLQVDPTTLEFVLIDDASDPEHQIPQLLLEFRGQVRSTVKILRFRTHRHYTHAVAYGLAAASGEAVLFVSHDMVVPPSCVTMLLQVAQEDPTIGIVRPSSRHMDGTPQHVISPPLPIRSFESVQAFSHYVATTCGNEYVQDHLLIGDAFLVKREVLDRIGVFDLRFRGFLGDLDFGLRAQRAGFKIGTALGAWLHHEGSGYCKETVHLGKAQMAELQAKHEAEVAAAFAEFRTKWDPRDLPEKYLGLDSLETPRLREMQLPESMLYCAPPALTDDTLEML
jgi:GT2 family glycosyltransferase